MEETGENTFANINYLGRQRFRCSHFTAWFQKTGSKTSDRAGKFIYTDSEEEAGPRSDPSSSVVRTKAAVKAFSPVTAGSRGRGKKASEPKSATKSTTDLIVPQRQAAKKATESLHSANANVSAKEKKEEKETKGVGKENVVLS
ncbi:PHD finger protein rhinoceros-like [Daphnia carinata]|uniref:PHD finger protein rhinoceros-like n=1 Tax=Daphnia carinata TaxID=120202 RepID=UPI00257C0F71|nr:PHD finger protein rhinoceros-like [Daphnia carinata]